MGLKGASEVEASLSGVGGASGVVRDPGAQLAAQAKELVDWKKRVH